ncbi:anti-adapter protein IraP [Erwinia sp. P6884]|uniref:anti-adapter protein IraP n=1 Tax=Erwinia sp. P6884 TaxID=3141450 RepID=UPI00318ACEB8
MKQLVIDILMKMAKIEVDTKELVAQVEAQSLLLAALLLTVGKKGSDSMSVSENIQNAIMTASSGEQKFLQSDIDLLLTHVNRLLAVATYVDEVAKSEESN